MKSSQCDKKRQLELLKDTDDIKYIVTEAYNILGHPVVLFDTSYNLLAYTAGIVTDDPIWNEFVTLGTFSHETVDFFNSEDFILAFADSEVVAMLKSDKLKYDRMNGKLFDKDNVQLGDIAVIACKKQFEDGDAELIELLCEILSVKLQNSEFYPKIERVFDESLFTDVLSGSEDLKDAERYREAVVQLYDGLNDNLYLAVVDISQYDHTVTHLAYFRDLFRKMQPEYKYFVHLSNIVILLSTNNKMLSIKRDMKALNEFYERYNIYAGISGRFQDLGEIKKYYKEAINALNYGLKGMRKQNIFSYDYYRIEHFLHSVASVNFSDKILDNPTVSMMLEQDRKYGTSFSEILYIYLLYGRDIDEAGKAFGIKSDELQEILKTIEDMFEIDWKNGDMLSNLFISLKMLKIN